MRPRDWRKRVGISQDDLGIQLGLQSRGRVSELERGIVAWPTDLAIRMDRLSAGAVTVAELRPDLHDVRVIRPDQAEGAGA